MYYHLLLQGRFEILCLSGSYLVVEEGGTRTRSGGLCIALCGPDHRVIGGSVSGVLTAAGTVQVLNFRVLGVACVFSSVSVALLIMQGARYEYCFTF